MRGEYKPSVSTTIGISGSPPLARGVPNLVASAAAHPRITPACAGSTPEKDRNSRLGRDHPRLRGEYFLRRPLWDYWIGSPPLARGVLDSMSEEIWKDRITPACAGSTSQCRCSNYVEKDHPRLRGEYYLCSDLLQCRRGSPPLARGVHSLQPTLQIHPRITPACAGSTCCVDLEKGSDEDHPRLRGEYKQHSSFHDG